MLNIGPQELLIILVIALLVVGPQRLPALGRSIGRGLRELRKAQDEVKRTIQVNLDDEGPNGRTGGVAARGASSAATDAPSTGEPVDAPPRATEPLPADEVREISRSLGKSLAQLRRARDEVQRSFRVDLSQPTKARRQSRPAAPSATAQPAGDGGHIDADRPEPASEPETDGPKREGPERGAAAPEPPAGA